MKLTIIVFFRQPQANGKNVVRYDDVSILSASSLTKQLFLMDRLGGAQTQINLDEVNALQIIPQLDPSLKKET